MSSQAALFSASDGEVAREDTRCGRRRLSDRARSHKECFDGEDTSGYARERAPRMRRATATKAQKTIFSRGFTSKHFNVRDEPPLPQPSALPAPLEEESEGEVDAERRMRRSSLREGRRVVERDSVRPSSRRIYPSRMIRATNMKSTDPVGWPEFSAAMQAPKLCPQQISSSI